MKNNYTLSSKFTALFLLFSTAYLSAQVVQKIGDNPFIINQRTVLELESTTKGFLPPRLNVSQQTSLGTLLPQGLLIYVTDGAHEGIQLWDGTKWIFYIDSAALALKANLESPSFTGTVAGITATMVGIGNVNNTSDLSKPISTATQIALDLKANLASPTFTGTVGGITATMVGLGNVNNTTDLLKPISTATQTALNLKANLSSPTFTGTVSGITATMVGLGNVNNTSDLSKPISILTQTALDLKEDKINKITDINSDPTSEIKYPSVSAVKNYFDTHNSIYAISTIERDYDVVREDFTILCNNTSNSFTVKLPDARESIGKIYVIRKIDESNNILSFSPPLKLTDLTEISSLNYPKTIRIQSNGTFWYIID